MWKNEDIESDYSFGEKVIAVLEFLIFFACDVLIAVFFIKTCYGVYSWEDFIIYSLAVVGGFFLSTLFLIKVFNSVH